MTAREVDVLIVGAGLSGIGAACHLTMRRPGTTYAILEARHTFGGTWDLFRYPGIRSDSDLHTFGFEFRPWRREHSLAGAQEILDYLHDTAAEYGVLDKISYRSKVVRADWSSRTARWTVDVVRTDPQTGAEEHETWTARWVFAGTGYYRYDRGFTPELPGISEFRGTVVHPQLWPEDLDYQGKRVVVIGSGATAVTLIPAMAPTAAHVTMLQRSPSYVMPQPNVDPLGRAARRVLGDERGYRFTRRKNIYQQQLFYKAAQRWPRQVRAMIRSLNVKFLPEDFPVDVHFKPRYDPWDQRLCVVPDADLFHAISEGKASVVTDTIAGFTADGVRLGSGEVLPCDVLVTATGLDLLVFGGIEGYVDGEKVDPPQHLAYKGAMLSDVPNFVFAIGYTNSSWTLKVDLVCRFLCRVLDEADRQGADTVVPVLGTSDVETRPLLDFAAGYVQRAVHLMPRTGPAQPWRLPQDYFEDSRVLGRGRVDDGTLAFSSSARRAAAAPAGRPAKPVTPTG